jgi:hypothetical protein
MYPKNEDIHQRHYETEIDVNTIIRIVLEKILMRF